MLVCLLLVCCSLGGASVESVLSGLTRESDTLRDLTAIYQREIARVQKDEQVLLQMLQQEVVRQQAASVVATTDASSPSAHAHSQLLTANALDAHSHLPVVDPAALDDLLARAQQHGTHHEQPQQQPRQIAVQSAGNASMLSPAVTSAAVSRAAAAAAAAVSSSSAPASTDSVAPMDVE
jgi:hypothetical protein